MLLLVVGASALVATIAAVLAVRWWTWRPLVRRRVVVSVGDVAFDGLVMSRRGPLLVLADVTVRIAGSDGQRIDGGVVLERARVDWVQVM